MLREEVRTQAGEPVVLAGKLTRTLRVAVEKHAAVAAAPQLRRIARRVHQGVDIGVRARADRSRRFHLEAGGSGLNYQPLDIAGKWEIVGAVATEVDRVHVSWRD